MLRKVPGGKGSAAWQVGNPQRVRMKTGFLKGLKMSSFTKNKGFLGYCSYFPRPKAVILRAGIHLDP